MSPDYCFKEVKGRLYGEDGHVLKEPISKSIMGKVPKSYAEKGKAQILDEYCCNTGQAREYIIKKIHFSSLQQI